MKTTVVLCLLIGFAYSFPQNQENRPWKTNTEYKYSVQGRALSRLNKVSKVHTGVFVKAELVLHYKKNGHLSARIQKSQLAEVNSIFPGDWESNITDSQLQYTTFPLSNKPFEIRLENGVVQEIYTSKDVPNWESNFIKSVVSQIQVDLQAQNMTSTPFNQKADKTNPTSAFFTKMEDSINGNCETSYNIQRLSDETLQMQPEVHPFSQKLKGDGTVIEVIKRRNFKKCSEHSDYYDGLPEFTMEESRAHVDSFVTKSSLSKLIVAGTLNRYTILSSVSRSEFAVNLQMNNEEKAIIGSMMNVTLVSVKGAQKQPDEMSDLISVGNLVYRRRNNSTSDIIVDLWRILQNSLQEGNSQNQNSNSALFPAVYTRYDNYVYQSEKQHKPVNFFQKVQDLSYEIAKGLQHAERFQEKMALDLFSILTEVIRASNVDDLLEAGRALHLESQSRKENEYNAWQVYRSAMAMAGTNSALQVLCEWITTDTISGQEARSIFISLPYAARELTPNYLTRMVELTVDPSVSSNKYINESAFLATATLSRRIMRQQGSYINHYSAYKYVIHQMIPYYGMQMADAIANKDYSKAQVFIRALGEIGHFKILPHFEPYLEGLKNATQFQRSLMVASLEVLAEDYPKHARSVSYRLLSNDGDDDNVRSIAMYQLMKTQPSASMLQQIAYSTRHERSKQVRSAIKSAIEDTAKLNLPEYSELAKNAQSALPLLSQETYGLQYPHDYLRSGSSRKIDFAYKQSFSYIGALNMPKSVYYSLRLNNAGLNRQYVKFQAISFNMYEMIESIYNGLNAKKQPSNENAHENNEQSNTFEQLLRLSSFQYDDENSPEGFLFVKLLGKQQFFSYQNTSRQIQNAMSQFVNETRTRKRMNYNHLYDREEIVIGSVTELGFPIHYSSNNPTWVQFNGSINIENNSPKSQQYSSNEQNDNKAQEQNQSFQNVRVNSSFEILLSTKLQVKIGFIATHNDKHFVTGWDRNVQLNLPVNTSVTLDFKNKQANVTFSFKNPERNTKLAHYSTWPYSSKENITSFRPTEGNPNTHIIHAGKHETVENVYGQKGPGMAFRYRATYDKINNDNKWSWKQARNNPFMYSMEYLLKGPLRHNQYDFEYDANHSSAHYVNLAVSYKKMTQKNAHDSDGKNYYESDEKPAFDSSEDSFEAQDSNWQDHQTQQREMLNKATNGFSSASTSYLNISAEFVGKKNVRYTVSTVYSVNRNGNQSRVALAYKKSQGQSEQSKPYKVLLYMNKNNTQAYPSYFTEALNSIASKSINLQLKYGHVGNCPSQINIDLKLNRSEERQRAIENSPMTQLCIKQMARGNKWAYPCNNLTVQANLMDQIRINISYKQIELSQRNNSLKSYSFIKYLGYDYFDENTLNYTGSGSENQIKIEANLESDNFEYANITVHTPKSDGRFSKVPVPEWMRPIVAIHTSLSPAQRFQSWMYNYVEAQATCIVDRDTVNTFSNRSYHAHLGHNFHVVFGAETNPLERRIQKFYQVLANDADENKKQVLIVTGESNQHVTIGLKPVHSKTNPKRVNTGVWVNDKLITLSDQPFVIRVRDVNLGKIYREAQDHIRIELEHIQLWYDMYRIKISVSSNLRGRVRGICGTYEDEPSRDFTSPNNCVFKNSDDLLDSYTIVNEPTKAQEIQHRLENTECYSRNSSYANVITDVEHNHDKDQKNMNEYMNKLLHPSCNIHQTKYVMENERNSICFTVRQMPACAKHCRPTKTVKKSVDVFCARRNAVVDMWKHEIDQGAVRDFSYRTPTKKIKIEVPQNCSPA